MSIKNNTTSLQDLLEQVNALPEAENLDVELSVQDDLISQIQSAVDNLPDIGSVEPCTVTIDGLSNSYDITISYLSSETGYPVCTHCSEDSLEIQTYKNSLLVLSTSDMDAASGYSYFYNSSGVVPTEGYPDFVCNYDGSHVVIMLYLTGEGTTGSLSMVPADIMPF